jgi:D-alanine--poly(phosphoribitol) ligase subunit 2
MIRDVVLNSLQVVNKEYKNKELEFISDNDDIFDVLDSMAILDLILEIEDSLHIRLGKYIQVADDSIMDGKNTPFKTVGTLVEFLEKKIN